MKGIDQTKREALIAGGDLAIREMRDQPFDYSLVQAWRRAPHVAEWWWTDDDPADPTMEDVIDECGPDIRHETPTTACIIEVKARPIGFLQFYPWAAYPSDTAEMGVALPAGYWGIDIFIGEASLVGHGYGGRAVWLIIDYLRRRRGAAGIALVVSRRNARALRAYEKAGLRRLQEVFDTDRRGGERIPSYLMATPGRD